MTKSSSQNLPVDKQKGAVLLSIFLNKYADTTVGADGNPPDMRDDCHRPLQKSYNYSDYALHKTAPFCLQFI